MCGEHPLVHIAPPPAGVLSMKLPKMSATAPAEQAVHIWRAQGPIWPGYSRGDLTHPQCHGSPADQDPAPPGCCLSGMASILGAFHKTWVPCSCSRIKGIGYLEGHFVGVVPALLISPPQRNTVTLSWLLRRRCRATSASVVPQPTHVVPPGHGLTHQRQCAQAVPPRHLIVGVGSQALLAKTDPAGSLDSGSTQGMVDHNVHQAFLQALLQGAVDMSLVRPRRSAISLGEVFHVVEPGDMHLFVEFRSCSYLSTPSTLPGGAP